MSNGPYIIDETCLVFAKNIEEENERLRAENDKLREALKPFAEEGKYIGNNADDDALHIDSFTVGDFRAAAAAIRKSRK